MLIQHQLASKRNIYTQATLNGFRLYLYEYLNLSICDKMIKKRKPCFGGIGNGNKREERKRGGDVIILL